MGTFHKERREIDPELVEEIKSKITIPMYFKKIIVPARSDYYAGQNTDLDIEKRTLCPLHSEDTPSFYYREDMGRYKCFGCGAYGDVISLHQEFTKNETGKSVSFESALNFLKKVFIDNIGVGANTEVKREEQRDKNKFTYMNAMYSRAFKNVMENSKISAEKKQQCLWELRTLREYCYSVGNSVVDEITNDFRKYSIE